MQLLNRPLVKWLLKEEPPPSTPLCDYERICYEIRPCDVLLVEGRSRLSDVIQVITRSPWSHSALYIGRSQDIENPHIRQFIEDNYDGSPQDQLVIEGYLGQGTVINLLDDYKYSHIRICRPRGLSRKDVQQVIAYAASKVGSAYNVRQIFDLFRLLLPWTILPRSWRSSLFHHNLGDPTRTVCSTMIAEAFNVVDFPILPDLHTSEDGKMALHIRNPRLFTPRDFDYSPYFEIIKYPFISIDDHMPAYRNLPWQKGRPQDLPTEK
ncbi:hypothetical protein Psal006b_01536 [Piscirickettsia salmonis]|uniref:Permuted papain-like amidase enzyme, YaeF n=1 Tax=Piscirickettsia salmonis TaxID=1238 RepID=A0A1L6TBY4_PISSA|nr:YiiX/YebB-like N1pC/P60 family cysteine hydrolase [Piscirickettsia salmonis]AKP74007.1 hypothetical protein PSLF89_2286 [Piscirickettsia salmonis LF-89 = ATCC VR-1361]ALB22853.1 Permuted papain-like amidase enzyme, YaeF [Piscirickettsia salmonis]ALY02831.1 hypothetical protein AWE47_08170 [Piscirickettsia salmonis]AMA42386.1 hypothetical protein AWJ11_08385 [Piscirickettsia salmonis]AOS34855.1 hypothetical protein AVM72_05525 [Piscirickettsia salmonis]